MIEALPLSGLSVLVVDDDRGIRDGVAGALRDEGAHVLVAGSAPEALTRLEGSHAHVVVTDITMPAVNGCALLRALRRRYPEPVGATPVIALSGLPSVDELAADAAGFDLLLRKPVDSALLVRAILRVVTPAPAAR